jgi:CheY-like chemotaxis protein
VAKILVADDNSNIQKMVGLALKDQGIEVVAVGNGEAAVRKIPDVKPDLVLADVFMPVRNGYEVCQFVKQNPALAHIPVILLVGAFDPLDEQEAQRVGADGVLKKPFVPPDPLIAMVKAALTRAGVSLTGEKTEKSAPKKAAEVVLPRPVPLPMSVKPPEPEPMVFEEMGSFVEDVPVQQAPPPVEIHGGAPLAFGNLMGSAETAEEDAGFAAPPAMERDWRAAAGDDEEVPEEEDEEAPKSSWRRDAADDEVAAESGSGSSAGQSNWRDLSFTEPATRKSAREDWGSEAAQSAVTEAASTSALPGMSFGGPLAAQPATSSVTENAPAISVAHVEPLQALSDDAWNSAVSAAASELENGNGISHGALGEVVSNGSATAAPANTEAFEANTRAVEHDAVSQAIDRFAEVKEAATQTPVSTSAATSDWELHALKATQLAATWDAPVRHEVAATVESVVAEVTAKPEVAATQEAVAAPAEQVVEQVVDQESAEASSYAAASLVEEPVREAAAEPVEDVAPASEIARASETVDAYQAAPEVAPEPVVEAEKIPEVVADVAEPAAHEDSAPETAAHLEHAPAAEQDVAPQPATVQTESQPELSGAVAATAFVEEQPAAHEAAAAPAEVQPAPAADADLVARVLASLSPEVMQSITREILKPVVEAMVREELNKKK